jgi:hypothetical protein
MVSGVNPAAGQKKAGLIEKETEVLYKVSGIKVRRCLILKPDTRSACGRKSL